MHIIKHHLREIIASSQGLGTPSLMQEWSTTILSFGNLKDTCIQRQGWSRDVGTSLITLGRRNEDFTPVFESYIADLGRASDNRVMTSYSCHAHRLLIRSTETIDLPGLNDRI